MAFAHALSDSGQKSTGPTTKAKRKLTPFLLLLPGGLWLGIFFVVPIFILFMTALQTPLPGGLPGQFVQTFTFSNFVEVLSRPQFIAALGRSFLYASIATLLALAIGYPLAYAIAFKAGRYKNIMLIMVIAPFFVTFILRTIAWRQILGDEGPVITVLRFVGLASENSSIYPSAISVVAGLAYNFLPFMTLPIYASLERMDIRLIEASGDLYAPGITTFWKVTLPISLPGVVAGTLLTFIPSAGDYINSSLLGNQRTVMIGNVIDARFLATVDYPTAAVLSFTLMLSILVIVTFYVRRTGTDELV
jgi:spermidine/putrescine transport system permease protein